MIRPASMIIAEFGTAAAPVPSIRVKPRRTRTSAFNDVVAERQAKEKRYGWESNK